MIDWLVTGQEIIIQCSGPEVSLGVDFVAFLGLKLNITEAYIPPERKGQGVQTSCPWICEGLKDHPGVRYHLTIVFCYAPGTSVLVAFCTWLIILVLFMSV